MAYVNVVKNLLRYQEQRRTLWVNALGKDEYGRHRGHVLYGLDAVPNGANGVEIRPGLLVTPWGTRFVYEAPLITPIIDIAAVVTAAGLSLAAAGDRPMAIALYASCALDGSTMDSVESVADLGPSTIEFTAKVVAQRASQGGPTEEILPADPLLQTTTPQTPANLFEYRDTVSNLNEVLPAPGLSPTSSVNFGEVLIGYLLLGTKADGSVVGQVKDPSLATWAEDVSYVRSNGLADAIAAVVGTDVLMGQTDKDTGHPTNALASYVQGALTQTFAPAVTSLPLTRPRYGHVEANGALSLYHFPSMSRDGLSLLDAVSRLDFMLRLWLDRTGDQALIQWTQDGQAMASQLGGGTMGRQATLTELHSAIGGGTTGADSAIKNFALWDDLVTGGATAWQGAVDPNDTVLKSGRVSHLLKAIDGADLTDANNIGDSTRNAVNAINRTIWHLLSDIFGRNFKRSHLRQSAAWTRSTETGLAFGGDVPVGGAVPTLAGTADTAYLTYEPIYTAMELLAQRINQGCSANWLKNHRFYLGDLASGGAANLRGWTIDTGTWTRTVDGDGNYVSFAVTGNDTVKQVMDIPDWLLSAAANGVQLGGSALVACTANLTLTVAYLDVGNAVLGSASQVINTGGATTFLPVSLALKMPTVPTGAVKLAFSLTLTGNGTFSCGGAWLGAGNPDVMPVFGGAEFDFMSRDGGAQSAMYDDLHMGGVGTENQVKHMADATDPKDAVNLEQLCALSDKIIIISDPANQGSTSQTGSGALPPVTKGPAPAGTQWQLIFEICAPGGGGGGGSYSNPIAVLVAGSPGGAGTSSDVLINTTGGAARDYVAHGGSPGAGGIVATYANPPPLPPVTSGGAGGTTAAPSGVNTGIATESVVRANGNAGGNGAITVGVGVCNPLLVATPGGASICSTGLAGDGGDGGQGNVSISAGGFTNYGASGGGGGGGSHYTGVVTLDPGQGFTVSGTVGARGAGGASGAGVCGGQAGVTGVNAAYTIVSYRLILVGC